MNRFTCATPSNINMHLNNTCNRDWNSSFKSNINKKTIAANCNLNANSDDNSYIFAIAMSII